MTRAKGPILGGGARDVVYIFSFGVRVEIHRVNPDSSLA